MLHHDCDSSKINWVRYDGSKNELYISFKPKGTVYIYSDTRPVGSRARNPDLFNHFENTRTAKSRNNAIGGETPGSEGSYLIHHVIGMRGQPAPYPFRKIEEEKVLA
jgi:hypothetical protein